MAFLHMALSKTQYNKIVKQSLKSYDKQAANGFWEIKHHNWVKYFMHGNIIIIGRCAKHVVLGHWKFSLDNIIQGFGTNSYV